MLANELDLRRMERVEELKKIYRMGGMKALAAECTETLNNFDIVNTNVFDPTRDQGWHPVRRIKLGC